MKNRFQVLKSSRNFLALDEKVSWKEAKTVILPVPLELTTTYMKGTGRGPHALLEASHQVELFDDELKSETYQEGIATLPPMSFLRDNPEKALDGIEKRVSEILQEKKRLVIVGGEHTVTVPVVRAYRKLYSKLSVLHLDAHADLRDSYEGSRYNHACVMARIFELCPFVSVGIRSLSGEEASFIRQHALSVYDMHRMREETHWTETSIACLGEDIYVTLDLDVFDPSVMPAVGTPEPGGMGWNDVLGYLREVFKRKHVVGLDVVELSPRTGAEYASFAAAKLLYRLIGYWSKF